LQVYATFAEEWMAMPVICGEKTASERFAGALETYSIEAMMQDGKALQAGTSHDLGQNFGKAFDVTFQNEKGQSEFVWQTSWGVSTRLIGGLIMTHSDDNGLVLPPKLAPIHVAIIPILAKNCDQNQILSACDKIQEELKAAGISAVCDKRDYKPGYKYHEWEQKGTPMRLEIGPRDLEKNQVMMKGRLDQEKTSLSMDNLAGEIQAYLDNFQAMLLERAKTRREESTMHVDSYDDFKEVFSGQNSSFVYAHWDGSAQTEAQIKAETKATIRCLPLNQPEEAGQCLISGAPSKKRVLFAKSY